MNGFLKRRTLCSLQNRTSLASLCSSLAYTALSWRRTQRVYIPDRVYIQSLWLHCDSGPARCHGCMFATCMTFPVQSRSSSRKFCIYNSFLEAYSTSILYLSRSLRIELYGSRTCVTLTIPWKMYISESPPDRVYIIWYTIMLLAWRRYASFISLLYYSDHSF
jgi:hypothetical protein